MHKGVRVSVAVTAGTLIAGRIIPGAMPANRNIDRQLSIISISKACQLIRIDPKEIYK